MNEIKICAICESSCSDNHKYEIGRNRFINVCDTCWFLIRSIIKEYLLENPIEQAKPIEKKKK